MTLHGCNRMEYDYSDPDLQDLIVQKCEQAQTTGLNISSPDNEVNLVVKLSDEFAVKFGIGVRAAEAHALAHAAHHLDPQVVKVPIVRQFFTRPCSGLWMTGYLVMDMIEGRLVSAMNTDESTHLAGAIVQAVKHLHSIPGDRPGPLDGSPARGLLWSHEGAGHSFSSKHCLQDYLSDRLVYHKSKHVLNVVNMSLVFCHMDISPRNLLIHDNGTLYLLDSGCSGFYPAEFEVWAIQLEAFQNGHALMEAVSSALDAELPSRTSTVQALMEVYAVNQQVAFPNPEAEKETEFWMRAAAV